MQKLSLTISGIDQLKELSSALRQFPKQAQFAATVTATRMATITKAAFIDDMQQKFDRPTPIVLKSVRVIPATLAKPEAIVGFDKRELGGKNSLSMSEVIGHNFVEVGGSRQVKRFEWRLQSLGILPQGMYVAPARGAILDSYGNLSRGQLTQILTQLGSFGISPMSARNQRKLKGQGLLVGRGFGDKRRILARQYFVAKDQNKRPLGIWKVVGQGRVIPVLIFIKQPVYKQIIHLREIGTLVLQEHLPKEASRALKDALANAGFKGRWK